MASGSRPSGPRGINLNEPDHEANEQSMLADAFAIIQRRMAEQDARMKEQEARITQQTEEIQNLREQIHVQGGRWK